MDICQNGINVSNTSADAPSQAHLQGTQSRHTKANLAKEPALFLRFRDTLCHGGHIPSIQVTKTKGEHITKVLLQLGLDGRTIISSAYPSFGFSGRNSAELLLVNINICL